MHKTAHTLTHLLLKESAANDVMNVYHQNMISGQVEASSFGLSRCWRQTFWTYLWLLLSK